MKDQIIYSEFLFARPSFIEGISRILDFGNTLNEYNTSSNPDEIAIRMDWEAVGNSLRCAILDYGKELKEKETIETAAK